MPNLLAGSFAATLALSRFSRHAAVACEPLPATRGEFLRPSAVEIPGDVFCAVLVVAALAPRALEDNWIISSADQSTGSSSYVPDGGLRALRSQFVSLSHRVPPWDNDEPRTLVRSQQNLPGRCRRRTYAASTGNGHAPSQWRPGESLLIRPRLFSDIGALFYLERIGCGGWI